ncbi:MAG: TonB-dependent receptor domain-containing protein, partial [Mycobacterium sp.]
QGFANIYQALRAMPLATGQVQGEQNNAGFTPGARTISLLGLPPDFTLFMIDGHPMSDYPLLYNGEASFTNISSVPLAMIDRIEIVPGNESSIYGSAAIAGVVNIILKQHQRGIDFNYQTGGYANGGGYSQRLQLVGGYDHNKFSMTYGLQFNDQQPIWGFQRPYTDSSFSNPNPDLRGVPDFTSGIYDYSTLNPATGQYGIYVDPNSVSTNGCNAIANQYGNTTVRFEAMNPGPTPNTYVPTGGYVCGSPYALGYSTLLDQDKSANAYLTSHYQLNDHTQLYGTLLLNYDSALSTVGPDYIWWEPDINAAYSGGSPGVIYNANTGTFQQPQELIAPEETGNIAEGATDDINRSYDFWGGVKGSLGDSNWNYDVFYARSQNNLVSDFQKPLTAKIDAFFQTRFLGPELGTTSGIPIYKPNYNNFFQNMTPAEYQSLVGIDHTSAETYTQNGNLQVTNDDLFSLPAGNVGFAGLLQVGNQSWSLPANPLLADHDFWGETGTSGGGMRNNQAAALEFRVPIFKMLSVDLSAREDDFHNDGGSTSGRPTYKAAFSFRPFDTLLLRANYSTAFRMPDMGYTFVGPSGYFTTVTDYYQCALQHPGTPYSECSSIVSNTINPEIFGAQTGNPFLKPITAKSWGGGVVWSPRNFTFKADYYDIRIANEVQYQSTNTLLLDDAACLLGQIPNTSPLCQAAYAAITRAGANAPTPYLLTGITTE